MSNHQEYEEKAFVLVDVRRGDIVYECEGRSYIRDGPINRYLEDEECVSFAQIREQNGDLRFDEEIVPDTGFETLSERLWRPLLTVADADDPRQALTNLRLLAADKAGVVRVTVAGILLCTPSPENWFPQVRISAKRYQGTDRVTGELHAQEIVGPLPVQIEEAVRFVMRNMRVADGQSPAREDITEYSAAAVFEAVVNAVVHRDYDIASGGIRISMFKDRLEIDTPGPLHGSMTIESMDLRQATLNEVIASALHRLPVANIQGSSHRRFLMERRGDGVSIIKARTRESAGVLPTYAVVNDSSVVLNIPAARLDFSPARKTVTVQSAGDPLVDVDVLALFPNKTWQRARTNQSGEAMFDLYTAHLPMTVYAAALGYEAGLSLEWLPDEGDLLLDLNALRSGGSVIFTEGTGQIPGLRGRLNLVRDELDRTYLYADKIAIEEGRQQPVHFLIGDKLLLTGTLGTSVSITIVSFVGKASLLEYRLLDS